MSWFTFTGVSSPNIICVHTCKQYKSIACFFFFTECPFAHPRLCLVVPKDTFWCCPSSQHRVPPVMHVSMTRPKTGIITNRGPKCDWASSIKLLLFFHAHYQFSLACAIDSSVNFSYPTNSYFGNLVEFLSFSMHMLLISFLKAKV